MLRLTIFTLSVLLTFSPHADESEDFPLTIETPMGTTKHPDYTINKLMRELSEISKVPKSKITTPKKTPHDAQFKPSAVKAEIQKIAREYATACIKMGCYCNQKGIPPACYDEPNRCCDGEAPKNDKTDLDKLGECLDNFSKEGNIINCNHKVYKEVEDPNSILNVMSHVEQELKRSPTSKEAGNIKNHDKKLESTSTRYK